MGVSAEFRWRTRGALLLAASCLLAACTAPATDDPTAGQPTSSTSQSRGDRVRAAVDAMFSTDDRGIHRRLRSILVSLGDQVVVERYRQGHAATQTLQIQSITKSVIATLVGMAVDEGRLPGVDQTLVQLLPEYADAMAASTKAVTLRQILTMTGGFSTDEALFPAGTDWVRHSLRSTPTNPPIGQFGYSNADSHVLAAILRKATGQSPLEYARSHLFEPLHISSAQTSQLLARPEDSAAYNSATGFVWLADPNGLHLGPWGLKLTARDLLSLGQLWRNEGRSADRQLVSSEWLRDATRVQAGTGDRLAPGYGYQFWITTADGHAAYAARGYAGQLIEVVPDLQLVVVIQSTSPADYDTPVEPGTADSGNYMSIVNTIIAPAATRP